MASAIKSVEGTKIVTAPSKGEGESGETVCVVEISKPATLGTVITAVEKAKTPHTEKVAPSVESATTLRFKAGTTREQIIDALKKAGLLEE